MSAFQYAPSNPYSCVLLEGFRKFLVDPYYEPLSWFMICTQYTPAKVGIKSCRCVGGCISFVHGRNYLATIVFDQTHVVSTWKAGWSVIAVC